MTLKDLLLTREEIRIPNPDKPYFVCPIHPKIMQLPRETREDSEIARSVFPDIYPLFLENLLKQDVPPYALLFREQLLSSERTLFRDIPEGKGKPLFLPSFFCQEICRMDLSTSVHVYYRPMDDPETRIDSGLFAVSLDKAREYCGESFNDRGDYFSGHAHCFLTHNVEAYQASLVLLIWSILYHNELLRLAFA